MDRIAAIRDCLTQRFTPQQLDIGDDSALHAGHAGAASGAGAVAVRWVSVAAPGGEARGYWNDVKPLHRNWIYAALMLGGTRRGEKR